MHTLMFLWFQSVGYISISDRAVTGFLGLWFFVCLSVEIGKHYHEDNSIQSYPVDKQLRIITV